jgi:DNA polymerase-4
MDEFARIADEIGTVRKVIHVDMDAFYASVEQRDDASLRGRPLVVGGARGRGVVAAASYEARRFGIKSAMPMAWARRACPDVVVVPPRFDRYREVSGVIRSVFLSHTPLVEPLSLDEAYLDVTGMAAGTSAKAIAQDIRTRIRDETGLTASAGVSINKFVAKLASDHRKPDGLTVVRAEHVERFVGPMSVSRFHGVGPATAQRLASMGVATGEDLRRIPLGDLVESFGSAGHRLHAICRGHDDRPVVPDRERKSFGSESTFERDLVGMDDLHRALDEVVEDVWSDRLRIGRMGRTVTLKAKHADFRIVSRSRTDDRAIHDRQWLERTAHELLSSLPPAPRGYRLLGVSLSNLDDEAAGEERGQLAMAI